jgi:hypothetical protein
LAKVRIFLIKRGQYLFSCQTKVLSLRSGKFHQGDGIAVLR